MKFYLSYATKRLFPFLAYLLFLFLSSCSTIAPITNTIDSSRDTNEPSKAVQDSISTHELLHYILEEKLAPEYKLLLNKEK